MSCDTEQFDLFPTHPSSADEACANAVLEPVAPSARKGKSKIIQAKPNPEPVRVTNVPRPEGEAGQRFLSVGEVARRYSVSVPTIWRWQKLGTIPQCYRIGSGTSRWSLAELEAHDLQLKKGGM